MNAWDQMRQAVAEAKSTLNAADNVSWQMAAMLRGRLRHANASDLKALKRELRDFNSQTGSWS